MSMIKNEEASSSEAPPVRTSLYVARQAAGLAVAADDDDGRRVPGEQRQCPTGGGHARGPQGGG
ncbi:hypothetical protein LUR56_38015 [Streptomyces sp. MT29]|nr:hypothetical protein [Streptomyces sp. MT29]